MGPTEVRFLNSSSIMEDENGDNVTLCLELVDITGVEAPVTVNFMFSGTAVTDSKCSNNPSRRMKLTNKNSLWIYTYS